MLRVFIFYCAGTTPIVDRLKTTGVSMSNHCDSYVSMHVKYYVFNI